jgi:hypothetical protein
MLQRPERAGSGAAAANSKAAVETNCRSLFWPGWQR